MVGQSIELCKKVRTNPKKFENETKSENSKVYFQVFDGNLNKKHVTKDKELALEDNDACTKNVINKENQPTHNVIFYLESSGVVKTPTLENKFNALFDVVVK